MDNPTHATVSRSRPDDFRAAGDGLTALGALLVLLGLFRALIVLEALPETAAAWWPAHFIIVAMWMLARGHRGPAVTLGAIGAGLLIVSNVPAEYVWPALLIVVGALVLMGTITGRQLPSNFPGLASVALFTDRDIHLAPGGPSSPLIAVFGEANGMLPGPGAGRDVVRCIAIFGEATLTIPRDINLDVSPTAVFGDVRTPEPPTGTPAGRVRVRATAVFGDVRIRRS